MLSLAGGGAASAAEAVSPPASFSCGTVEAPHRPIDAAQVLSLTRPGTPARAAGAPSYRSLGTKRVLVLRVDFTDVSGPSVSAADAQIVMDTQVRPFFEAASYGQTTLVTTVAPQVYRMSRTASSYALTVFAGFQLVSDAKAAAAATYPAGTYDRVIVAFPNIGPSRIPGSLFTDAAAAIQGGDEAWINDGFSASIVAHELGHTYGLGHSNLWQVADGNAVSMNGRAVEYGDPFDVMGKGWDDGRADFNLWEKYWLGWLPDTAVRTIASSGTYRVFRFDHRNALAQNQPLALRVSRDGQRSYWIGLRQGIAGNALLANGAYVLWGYDAFHATELLDLTTPGTNASDAALGVGRTFTDPIYGITLKPVARGGSDSSQYLDIEIVIPAAPADGVQGWHGEGGTTFVPPGLTSLRSLSADDSHIVALKQDGTVMGWWYNGPLLDLPPGFTNVASVTAGSGMVGAVKTDGSVQLWGPEPTMATLPPGLAGVRQLAIGSLHVLALKNDGTVVAWGANDSGQTTLPPGLANVVAVAAGSRFSAALKADGTVVRWGASGADDVPLPAGLNGVIAIASNSAAKHLVVLRSDGTVLVAGENRLRQANVPAGLNHVVAIAAGSSNCLALRADGTLAVWGSNHGYVPPNLPRVYAMAGNSQANFVLTGTGALITGQPAAQTLAAGQNLTLNVGASALGSLGYQWRKDGRALPGATGSSLTIPSSAYSDAGSYDVVVTTSANTVTSFPARVAIVAPLLVTQHPQAQQAELGTALRLTAGATGGGPLTYQWRKDGSAIAGATGATLDIAGVTASDAGTYDVAIADGVSTALSAMADVGTFAAARISNLSIRSRAGTGSQTLVVGFVVGGGDATEAKPLLLRGAGPALVPLGVADALADPRIELYSGSTQFAENDNWAGNARIASVAAAVGAFAFGSPTSADAALYREMENAGAYTLQISGAGSPQGLVLAEIYDATTDTTFGVRTRRLVNVAARTEVGTGGSILIAGFSITGRNGRRVLIRAIGPTLADFGVPGTLSDPRLELYDAAGGKRQENDSWGATPELIAASAAVGAFALPAESKDAAILATLPPGSYTVHVSGVGGTTGVALVEIYEVP